MQSFLSKIKDFNNKHRKIAPFIIWIEIILIFLASIMKNICRHYKILLAVVVVLIVIGISARHLASVESKTPEEGSVVAASEEMSVVEEALQEATVEASNEASGEESLINVDSAVSETSMENVDSAVSETSLENADAAASLESTASLYVDSGISEFIKAHTEAVGWIKFEDDLISYPIMQAEDNSKYAIEDADGNDSETGAIFLDYRSSADFSDSNTIIYGHNMRDRSMFGALKNYKEDLGFLDDHKYFQIITPEGSGRYMLFAFMDVPKNSYIYDVCGDNTSRMREFLDTIEYKTYIDTGIEPTVDDKIITLSTCTQKDDLFFVMFAVKVDD
ncbi:sortase, SrtB family [Butyrivibrio sp. Su6]|uniref:class B sortase n=1 Tax=Butyrivibrio sp. Su6 TaxID=1520810 RepID=UPI00089E6C31|nr:class B sortase [Butyrivibrio sp. Su6]SEG09190.1 sortase, SrtB family [Butyrivibrio sp. Su6]